jgi:hypothetical protein
VLVTAPSCIGILDSDTIASLDDATPPHDYYNVHVRAERLSYLSFSCSAHPRGFLASQTGRIALQLHLQLRFRGRFFKDVTRP